MVQPVVKTVWQPVVSCIQTFNRLSNPVWQPVERTVAVRSTRLSNRLSPVVQPCWQPVVSCKRGIIISWLLKITTARMRCLLMINLLCVPITAAYLDGLAHSRLKKFWKIIIEKLVKSQSLSVSKKTTFEFQKAEGECLSEIRHRF